MAVEIEAKPPEGHDVKLVEAAFHFASSRLEDKWLEARPAIALNQSGTPARFSPSR